MERLKIVLHHLMHFCVRLHDKVEPEHVVTIVALLVTAHAENPTMMAFAYTIIGATHTITLVRKENRAKAEKEIHQLELREEALEREVKRDEKLERIG